jgi:hypothetical protein
MIRHAAQTFKHLVLTVLLIIGGVCALEVGLRIQRATKSAAVRSETTDVLTATTTPSRATYLSVVPKLRFTRTESESGRPFTLRTNSFGLRSPEMDVPRPEGCFRILCLGDDNTFAGDLPESYTYPRILSELIQSQTSTRVEVLNAGCPGGCPTISALLLRHRYLTLQPDVIVVHIDPSDLADEELLRRHVERTAEGFPLAAMHPAAAGRTNLAGQLDDELLVVQTVRDEVRDLWNRGQSGSSVAGGSREADLAISGTAFGSIRAALESIARLGQAQSIEVVVSTAAPPPPTKRGRKVESTARQWPPEELRTICEELRLTVIDATPDIEEAGLEPRRSAQSGTLSGEANEVYAERLAQTLLERFMATPATQGAPPPRVSSQSIDR